MSRSVVVELFGLPGAGKSMLATAVVTELRRRGVPSDRPTALVEPGVVAHRRIPRKLALAARAAARDPRGSARSLRGVIAAVRRGAGDAPGRSLQWLSTVGLIHRARATPGVALLEEGTLQAIWSVGIRGDVTAMLERVDPGSATVDLVVVVEAPPATLVHRLETRASRHSRLQRASDVKNELRSGADLLERILEWRQEAGVGGDVVRVPHADDAEHRRATQAIVERVARLLGGGAVRA